jgi:hypothetical protein
MRMGRATRPMAVGFACPCRRTFVFKVEEVAGMGGPADCRLKL